MSSRKTNQNLERDLIFDTQNNLLRASHREYQLKSIAHQTDKVA